MSVTAIHATVAALTDEQAMALWRGTSVTAYHGRARAAQERRARRVIAEIAPVPGTDHLPVRHWREAAAHHLNID